MGALRQRRCASRGEREVEALRAPSTGQIWALTEESGARLIG